VKFSALSIMEWHHRPAV